MSASWIGKQRSILCIVWTSLVCLAFSSCQNEVKESESTDTSIDSLRYATKFLISESEITVKEPWPGAHDQKYQRTKVPKRIVCTSTTHLQSLELLGVEHTLVGFPSTDYIYSPSLRAMVSDGKIKDLGAEANLNMELLISLNPDLVIAFDAGGNSGILTQIEEAGIPVMLNADYLETSALGRAEWIKFFGAIFNKKKEADSIFTAIESKYYTLKGLASNVSSRPTIISGIVYGDVWFLPAGKNWSSAFYQDAGGQYLWADNENTGWLELSFESVFDKGRNADFWIGVGGFASREQVSGQDGRYTQFSAFNDKKLFNYDNRLNEFGGNDFFESAYSRPDLVLADLIHILHPELLPDYRPVYYRHLP